MHRKNQHLPVRVQRNSIVQFLKKADFLKPAFGSVRPFHALRQSVLVAVRRRAFFYLLKGVKEYEFEIYLPQLWDTFRL